jgi:hypothetical protein
VDEAQIFIPPRRAGYAALVAALIGLAAAGAWGLWQASQASLGLAFLLYLLPAAAALALGPLLVYRIVTLRRGVYTLQRDAVNLQWGLRRQQIPMRRVEWVALEEDSGRLPRPWFSLPGAVLGIRRLPDGREVEYLAGRTDRLVVIATQERLYAISPTDPTAFLAAFERCIELGALRSLPERSIYPTFIWSRLFQDRTARLLLGAGLLLTLALLVTVSLAVPGRSQVVLGFLPDSQPVPAIRLLLLPAISIFFFLLDMLLGLYFFRRGSAEPGEPSGGQPGYPGGIDLAYLLWCAGLMTPALLLLGVMYILSAR